MRPEDLLQFRRATPFRPFRLTLTDGRTFAVRHPELIMIGRTTAEIGLPSPRHREPVYDRVVTISLVHVMQVEVLPDAEAN